MANRSEWDFPTIAQAARAIAAAAADPHELAETAYLEFARLLPTDFFQLGIFEGDQYETLIRIQDGDREPNQVYPIGETENLIGWVRRTRQPLLVSNFETQQSELPAQPGYQAEDPPVSALFLPLTISQSTIGILILQSREEAKFDATHLELVSILSHSLVAALTDHIFRKETEELTLNLVLIQEISRLLLSLEPLPDRLQQALGLIRELLKYQDLQIFEYDQEQLELHSSTATVEGTSPIPDLVTRLVEEDADLSTPISDTVEGPEGISIYEYAFPLRVVEYDLGVLHLQSSNRVDLEGDEGRILTMFANQLGFAMLEARNYDERQEEAWMTTVLLEVAKHAAQPGDTLVALQAVLQLATLLAGTDWALLLLPDEQGEELRPGVHAGFRRQQALSFESIRLEKSVFALPDTLTESELPDRIDLPEQLREALTQDQALCFKLSDGSKLLGLLLLQDNPLPGIRPSLLAGIGHQISLRLENARLIEEAAVRRSLERELMMARSIQSSFLPEGMPTVTGWELASAWEVAREVGGDFYDFIPLEPDSHGDRWGIIIADVADKGIPAALYMALCRTMLRSVAQTHILPSRTLEVVNQQLITDTRADLFVSVFYGVWQPATATITYANAGHLPPFLFKPGSRAEILRDHGMVLGVMADTSYADQTLQFDPGDLLVLYTDGVSEAQNDDQELFGLPRIESLILAQDDWSAEAIASAIVKRVVNYSGGTEFSDDLTTVTIRRTP